MIKIIRFLLSISLGLYFTFGLFLFFMQDKLLYFPSPKTTVSHDQKVFINQKESIDTTVLNKGKQKAILYFGGNAENVDSYITIFTKIFPNYTLYLVKYRGYGESTGEPTEKALYNDALFIYDSIKNDYLTISLIGRSLGSGVSTYLASQRDVDKLALITPFDSIQSVAQEQFPIYPMSILLKDKYNSIANVDKIKSKTLILMAENDKIVTNMHTKNLADKFPPSQVTVKVIKGENHNSISSRKLYYTLLKRFFQ